jgi:dinuclear metal center YbgI/SA1388 family protein
MTALQEVVRDLDGSLRTREIPDYDRALNGLQLANAGTVHHVAAAVDFSLETVQQAVAVGADLLVVHHGMFWGGLQPLLGAQYERLRLAFSRNLAVYSSHLPLDCHETLGNNARLAAALGLLADGRFGRHHTLDLGVTGTTDLETQEIVDRVRDVVEPLGTRLVVAGHDPGRRTRRWAVLTGAGASSAVFAEASAHDVDTLIVGEGPHHTAVEARERGLAVIYAGHYATETFGVQALAEYLEHRYALPWSFLHIPSGL